MRLRTLIAVALLLAVSAPAAAASASPLRTDLTVTPPESGQYALQPYEFNGNSFEAIILEGTWAPEFTESHSIVFYIDGRLLSCESFFGNDVNEDFWDGDNGVCYRVAQLEDDGTWYNRFGRAEIERLGLEYLGPHTVEAVLIGRNPGSFDYLYGTRVTVEAQWLAEIVEPDPEPVAEPEPVGAPPVSGTSRLASGDAAAPSILSALRPMQDRPFRPQELFVALALTLVLLVVVAWPSQLLSSTLSTHYDRVFGWAAPLRARADRLVARAAERGRLPAWWPVPLALLAATTIGAFVDPQFGANPGSLRVYASMAVTFLVESLLATAIVLWVVRRRFPDARPTVTVRWASFLLLVATVLFTRLSGLEPGLILGVMLGLGVAAGMSARASLRAELAGLGVAAAFALIAWGAYSLALAVIGPVPGTGERFLLESLAGITTGGLAALPIVLLPVAMFPGGALWAHSRRLWLGVYAAGALAFLLVILPLPASWGGIEGPFAAWAWTLLAYGLLAVGVWALFRFVLARRGSSG